MPNGSPLLLKNAHVIDPLQNIDGVTQASGQVGTAAELVLGSAGELAKQSERLKQEVESFLATVRAA